MRTIQKNEVNYISGGTNNEVVDMLTGVAIFCGLACVPIAFFVVIGSILESNHRQLLLPFLNKD